MPALTWQPAQRASAPSTKFHSTLREPRRGVMVHYDGSSSDRGGLEWLLDPRCVGSYQVVVADDGQWVQLVPDTARAWHAGVCRTSDPQRLPYHDANSAFLGIAVLTDGQHAATVAQMLTVAWKIRTWYAEHGWDPADRSRIVGHDTEAVYPAEHRRAGQRGRKIDPTGVDPRNPVLALADLRYLVPRIEL